MAMLQIRISSMSVGEVYSRTHDKLVKKDLYLLPRAKLNVFRNTLHYFGAQIWNNVPANVKKNVPSVYFT